MAKRYSWPGTSMAICKYTNKKILDAAKTCSSKREFRSKFNGEYQAAHRKKLIDKACAHMVALGSLSKRYNYSILFDDGSVYTGISFNVAKRISRHKNGFLHKKMMENSYTVFIHGDIKEPKEAANDEALILKEIYSSGATVLNRIKAGGLGGCFKKWSRPKIIEVAKKCASTKEFEHNYPGAYLAASRHGMLKSGELDFLRKFKRHKNEDIFKIAKNFKTRVSFKKQHRKEYDIAWKRGILDDVCSHMQYVCKPKRGTNDSLA
ncbi:MAG TPA: hypothetical protein PK886_03110 [Candidatus Paceibacterota bacterium]|nr:hypothetical protein [Candidatus Paceibacterota bacterium]